jgi:hypothetical protein
MEVRESWQGCRHCRPPRRLCRHHHSNVGWFHQHFNVTYTQSLDLVPPSSPTPPPPPQAATKEEETPLSIAGSLAPALRRAAEGDVYVDA